MEDKLNDKIFEFENETQHHTGKYFRHVTRHYKISDGQNNNKVNWECFYRTNINDYKSIYGSEIIGLVKSEDKSTENIFENTSVILIENYRYPVDKKILEFPSGIIEHNEYENLEDLYKQMNECKDENEKEKFSSEYDKVLTRVTIGVGERELKEETGYVGTFKGFFALPNVNPMKIFANTFYDPWKSLENAAISIFEIDKSLEENKNPKQVLEDCEIIKVHEVKLSELLNFISEKIDKENYGCSTHVYSFAMGLQFSNILKGLYN